MNWTTQPLVTFWKKPLRTFKRMLKNITGGSESNWGENEINNNLKKFNVSRYIYNLGTTEQRAVSLLIESQSKGKE